MLLTSLCHNSDIHHANLANFKHYLTTLEMITDNSDHRHLELSFSLTDPGMRFPAPPFQTFMVLSVTLNQNGLARPLLLRNIVSGKAVPLFLRCGNFYLCFDIC